MAAAEEASAPAAEESAPLPQGETVAPAAEATLPEASMVEGEYAADGRLPRVVVLAHGKLILCVF
jgi:hypothetical protein